MLGVTASCYFITKRLFQQAAAVFASVGYASTGVVLFLGRLATFDAMCLCLIAVAAAMAVHGGTSKRPWITLAIGPVLVLAILTKYAALLFVAPVLGLLACVSLASLGWWRAMVRLALTLTTGALSLGAAYELIDRAALHAIAGLGLRQSHTLFSNWANTARLSYELHTQLRDGSGRIFAEDIEVARYDARDVTEQWQWNSFYYPYYVDAAHHVLLGDAALIASIRNRYYDFVELSFNYFPAKAYWLAGQMATSRNYDLIGIVPLVNSYGRGHFYLWRAALVPGGGKFRSLAQLKTNIS